MNFDSGVTAGPMSADEAASRIFGLMVAFCDAVELRKDTYEAFLALEEMDSAIEEAQKIQARPEDTLDGWSVRNKSFMLRHYARAAFWEVRKLEPCWGYINILKRTMEGIVNEMRWQSHKRIAGHAQATAPEPSG